MLERVTGGSVYRVGIRGARIVYPDGAESIVLPFQLVTFSRQPRFIEGRLSPVGPRGLGYEAPALVPREVKSG